MDRSDGTTFYEKHGRRYVPVANTDLRYPYRNGCYLVIVKDGVTSTYHQIEPDNAAVEAAMKLAGDDLTRFISEESSARPTSRDLTAKEKKAIAAFREVMGSDGCLTMTIPSAADIGERVVQRVMERVQDCENVKERT